MSNQDLIDAPHPQGQAADTATQAAAPETAEPDAGVTSTTVTPPENSPPESPPSQVATASAASPDEQPAPSDGAAEEGGGDGSDPSETYPMLRPLDCYPVDVLGGAGGPQKVLALSDPSGIAPGIVNLPPLGAAVIELCDGTRTREQICTDFAARFRRPLSLDGLNAMLQKLDDALMLDSTRFRLHCARIFAEFAALDTRPALSAGTRYPADPDALQQALRDAFGPPHGPGLPAPSPTGSAPVQPRALLAPTLDVSRAGPAYAWSYRPLLDAPQLPSIIVLLGCDHAAHDPLVTLTRKHLATPIGTLRTDTDLVDTLIADMKDRAPELGELMTRDEAHHRGEHSLELQAIWLRFILNFRRQAGLDADAPEPLILPILVGPLHELAANPPSRDGKLQPHQTTRILDEFCLTLQNRIGERQKAGARVLWICATDLAHVGPRFGDAEEVVDADRDSLEQRDRETFKPMLSGDAVGFLAEIRRERDRRHIYGLGALYLFLAAARPTGGKLRCYAQCAAEGGSYISLASALFQ